MSLRKKLSALGAKAGSRMRWMQQLGRCALRKLIEWERRLLSTTRVGVEHLGNTLKKGAIFFRRHLGLTVVGAVTLATLSYVVSLYLPTILSDYGRAEFAVRYDCDLTVSGVSINLVDPPDAYVSIHLTGFSQSECNQIQLRDDTQIFDYEERSFIGTAEYSDDILSDISGSRFEHSPFHLTITKTQLQALYEEDGGSDPTRSISDSVQLHFTAPKALTRTSFSRSVLPVFPSLVDDTGERDNLEQVSRIIVSAPQGYIYSSSAPQSPTALIAREDGVVEVWFDYRLKDPGLVVYFENARGGAIGELMLFISSGVFGFAIGFLADRTLVRPRITANRERI